MLTPHESHTCIRSGGSINLAVACTLLSRYTTLLTAAQLQAVLLQYERYRAAFRCLDVQLCAMGYVPPYKPPPHPEAQREANVDDDMEARIDTVDAEVVLGRIDRVDEEVLK